MAVFNATNPTTGKYNPGCWICQNKKLFLLIFKYRRNETKENTTTTT
jgi:hypothetical protein